MEQDEKPQEDQTDIVSKARISASLRMLGLGLGAIAGMVVGVALDSILLGAALGIGVGLAAAALLDRITTPRIP